MDKHFLEYIREKGWENQSEGPLSTMGTLRHRYTHPNYNFTIVWGLNQRHRPPTLVHPQPAIRYIEWRKISDNEYESYIQAGPSCKESAEKLRDNKFFLGDDDINNFFRYVPMDLIYKLIVNRNLYAWKHIYLDSVQKEMEWEVVDFRKCK